MTFYQIKHAIKGILGTILNLIMMENIQKHIENVNLKCEAA